MEKLTELRTYRVDFVCEQCGEGHMVYTRGPSPFASPWFPTGPPQSFPHQCTECRNEQYLRLTYPAFRYEDVEVADSHHQKQTKEETDVK